MAGFSPPSDKDMENAEKYMATVQGLIKKYMKAEDEAIKERNRIEKENKRPDIPYNQFKINEVCLKCKGEEIGVIRAKIHALREVEESIQRILCEEKS